MAEKPDLGGSIIGDSKQTTTSTGSTGPSVPDIPEGVARLIIDAIEQEGTATQTIELPAFAEDAGEVSEEVADYYDLDDAETMSVEDLFGYDWSDYDYVGTPPTATSESLTDEEKDLYQDGELYKSNSDEKKYVTAPEYVEALRGNKVLKGAVTPLVKALNGLHYDLVTEHFGDDKAIAVGKGKSRNHDGDDLEAMKYVAFWVTDSSRADLKRMKARRDAGTLSDEELAEWASENGYTEEDL